MDEHTTESGRPSMSPDEIRAHNEHDHLAAVFADRPHAVDAVDELRSLGLGSEHLGIAVHGDDAVAFEHDASPMRTPPSSTARSGVVPGSNGPATVAPGSVNRRDG